jgi:L-amino acid N-acyltransferase YncA
MSDLVVRLPLLIRPAAAADIAAITEIYAHAVRHGTATFDIEAPEQTEMRLRLDELRDGGFPYLVCQIDGQVQGYAYAALYRTRAAYRYTLEDSIYVAPTHQRRGIGRALLDRLLAQAAARGFRQMIAVIGDSAQAGSIALHCAAGFRMVGRFEAVGYKFDRWLDTVLMQRALGPEDAEGRGRRNG